MHVTSILAARTTENRSTAFLIDFYVKYHARIMVVPFWRYTFSSALHDTIEDIDVIDSKPYKEWLTRSTILVSLCTFVFMELCECLLRGISMILIVPKQFIPILASTLAHSSMGKPLPSLMN